MDRSPLISDEEYNELKERFMTSLKEDWANNWTPNAWQAIGGNITALIELLNLIRLKESSERLEKSSQRLNILTITLMVLTTTLLVLTILAYKGSA